MVQRAPAYPARKRRVRSERGALMTSGPPCSTITPPSMNITRSDTSRAKLSRCVTMDHGRALLGEAADDAQHLARQLRVERAGGLVEAEDVRVHGQRAGDGHALLLPARELVR